MNIKCTLTLVLGPGSKKSSNTRECLSFAIQSACELGNQDDGRLSRLTIQEKSQRCQDFQQHHSATVPRANPTSSRPTLPPQPQDKLWVGEPGYEAAHTLSLRSQNFKILHPNQELQQILLLLLTMYYCPSSLAQQASHFSAPPPPPASTPTQTGSQTKGCVQYTITSETHRVCKVS